MAKQNTSQVSRSPRKGVNMSDAIKKSVEKEQSRAESEGSLASRFALLDKSYGSEAIKPVIAKNNATESVLKIKLAEIMDNPLNARRIYEEDVIKTRSISIASHGQMEPVKLMKLNIPVDGKSYILLDGQYRKRAIELLNLDEIDGIVIGSVDSVNDKVLYTKSFKLNEERSGQTALDNAIAWSALLRDKIFENEDEIAKDAGVERVTVERTMSIFRLPDDIVTIIESHPHAFPYTLAYELYLFYQDALDKGEVSEVIKFADRVVGEGLGRRDVSAARQAFNNKKVRRRLTSRQYAIKSLSGVSGKIKDWDNGRIVLDVQVTDADKREKILATIRDMFTEP